MAAVWLVDADNQSFQLARSTGQLLGWPDRVILAGLAANIRAWQEKAGIPSDVQVDVWVSPAIPDGADVLLAMAVGGLIDTLERVTIFSRDGLVAGTLGRLLYARGIQVLAVAAKEHPGLPYPHLTLPVAGVRQAVTPPIPRVPAEEWTQEFANQVFASVFEALGNPASINRANFYHQLGQRGFNAEARATLTALAQDYTEIGSGTNREVYRIGHSTPAEAACE